MATLSSIDTHNLLQGIQTLYTCCNLETFGVDALTIVNQLVPSDIPTFHTTEVRARRISHDFLPDFPGFAPEIDKVIDRNFDEHPILHHMPQTLHGAYQIADFVSQQELHCFEGLYQQFLRPLDLEAQMTLFLPNAISGSWREVTQTDTTLVGFSLNRAQGFTECDRLILNLLRPHLFQAYQNAQKSNQLGQDLSQLQRSMNHLGLVNLNREGQVQWATSQAIQWFETYFAKPTSMGSLPDRLQAWVKHQVAGLTIDPHQPQTGAPLHIELACKKLVIRLMVAPAGEGYSLLLEEQTRSNLQSLEILGLSQRETEVLGWLIQGKDNKTIATHMDISASTIRKHLESIYRKLGVQSRTEAVSAAFDQLGLL
jgi:DNA-binding CsgD family transcriptional regulator